MSSKSLSRRAVLRTALTATPAAVATVFIADPAQAKASQETVNYQSTPNGDQTCETCRFYEGDGVCSVVEGAIEPQGWCKLFQPKS